MDTLLGPSATLGFIALGAGALAVRRLFPDRALQRFKGQRFTFWSTTSECFWGALEPRAIGFALEFDHPYQLPGEPLRRGAIVAAATGQASIALAHPHSDTNLFGELSRAENAHPRGRPDETSDTWSTMASGARALLDGADRVVDRALDPRRARALQDAWLLERWRGRLVVVELENGARTSGFLIEIGRAWLAFVTPPGALHERVVTRERTVDGPLHCSFEDGTIALRAEGEPVHVATLANTKRSVSIGVTLLPGTTLKMPWSSLDVVASGHSGVGLDLLVPRATARIVYAAALDSASPAANSASGER